MVHGVITTQTGILCKAMLIAKREQTCRWFVQPEEVVRTELDPRRRGSGVELRPLLVEVVLRDSIGHLGERGDSDTVERVVTIAAPG